MIEKESVELGSNKLLEEEIAVMKSEIIRKKLAKYA